MSYIFCTSCQLNQHLQDSLCQQLLQLDEVSILSPAPASIREGEEEGDGDMEQQVLLSESDKVIFLKMSASTEFCFQCLVSLDQASFTCFLYSRKKRFQIQK